MAINTAIRHLERGDWEKAHAIAQHDASAEIDALVAMLKQSTA
jgi:hypothetical protein